MRPPAIGWLTRSLMLLLALLMACAAAIAWLLERRSDYNAREDFLDRESAPAGGPRRTYE